MRLIPLLLLATVQASAQQPPQPVLIPRPVELSTKPGACDLTCGWVVKDAPERIAQLLRTELATLPQQRKPIGCEHAINIDLALFTPDTLLPPEWYALTVMPQGIAITAPTEAGLFRGSRTLVQLLEQGLDTGSIPCLSITDFPRFPWRGMHLDPCRHFWSVEFTKKYIDLLARYKMNSFHWHLTDDQGWRIEIKKHPRLTEVGAWRKGSQVGPYAKLQYDSIPYGGFYTQDQIREVVAYAAARHINVVPEIEMPGHALAALAAYPHLGCTGGPYEVNRGWGVFEDVFCAGNDSVFAMLEDVLTEVMALFPSEVIHIGGDECPKEAWKVCAKCQARMKAGNLKDEHELQSYFIQRIERFVNSKGRKIIGWDEILEGGLAPNAAVMSWRGTEGGIAAARSGHYAVMSPGSHCYFDHYQGDPANEPLAIGGYTPLQKVYSYEPIPAELKPEEHKYILGAQGNLWTEYILTPEHVEYMVVPRMLALAEVLWTPKEARDEKNFIERLESEFHRLEALDVNVSKSLYQVRLKPRQGSTDGSIDVEFIGSREGQTFRYELNEEVMGAETPAPKDDLQVNHTDQTTGPITIRNNCTLVACVATDDPDHGWSTMPRAKRTFRFNKATARPITISVQPNERYNEGGAFTLVDGITAQERRVNTEWLGWKESVTLTVDLGSVQDVRHIGIGAWNDPHSWIHLPSAVDFSTSLNGSTFTPFGRAQGLERGGRNAFSVDSQAKARYVRVAVTAINTIPVGDPGAGNPAWMFLDEIEVR